MWAMVSGIRFVRHSPDFRSVLIRSLAFAGFAVVLWALLPLVTRQILGGDAADYGLLLGSIGLGAAGGALILPSLRKRLGPERLTLLFSTVYGVVVLVLATAPPLGVALLVMLPAGFAYIAMLSTLHVSAQVLLPGWVRARGLSVSLMVFFGSMALGSLVWGMVGSRIGLTQTLVVAGLGLLATQVAALWFKLPREEGPNLLPSRHWPAPDPEIAAGEFSSGHVLVMIRYKVEPTEQAEFFRAAEQVRRFRLRSGAFGWRVYRDPGHPGWLIETFMNRDWHDHLRLHERVTEQDREIQERLNRYHRGTEPPRVTHLIGVNPKAL